MTVKLRQRLKGDTISLYLDYYHKGKRSYEYLQLYLYPEPEKGKLTKEQKSHNKQNLALAESICAKRHLEIQNGQYGFKDRTKLQASFLTYMEQLATKRSTSQGNAGNWDSALIHLRKFIKPAFTFAQLDRQWLETAKEYMMHEATQNNGKPLSQNSQCAYFNKIKAAVRQAYKDGILPNDIAGQVDSIPQGESNREFLTLEELKKVAQAECEIPILKNAFLFSCLTGLRWSDIEKLTWSEIQHSEENGYYIRFRQKKTKGAETLPISEQAIELLGERKQPTDKVFAGLQYSAWYNLKLQQWVMKAGITKTITFHCARHTYATLQLSLGTDIYTVSKLLGHKNLRTTQVYAKIIDEKKKDAANKISLT